MPPRCDGFMPHIPITDVRGNRTVDTSFLGAYLNSGSLDGSMVQYGAEVVFVIDVPAAAVRFTIDTLMTAPTGVADTVLTATTDCPRGALQIPDLGVISRNDDASAFERRSQLILDPVPTGRVYIIVDGYSAADSGMITVSWNLEIDCSLVPFLSASPSTVPDPAASCTPKPLDLPMEPFARYCLDISPTPTATVSATPTTSRTPTRTVTRSASATRSVTRSMWPSKAKGSRQPMA